MNGPIKPIYLLADSQLLFWKSESGRYFLESMLEEFGEGSIERAAYIGASNENDPRFFELFRSAMEIIRVKECRMIGLKVSIVDELFLDSAQLIVLAGGDAVRGWRIIERNGLKEKIVQRYYGGAMLLGISAGAVQLGLGTWPSEPAGDINEFVYTFKFVPFVIDVHDRTNEWRQLKRILREMGAHVKGLGIPSGGGLTYHPDHSIEPVRYPVYEFSLRDDKIVESLLM